MPISVWALGFVSLLMDTSSEMVHGILPVFLVSSLGATFTTVGILEGISEAATLALKVIAGPLSDWFGKRKPLVVVGYAMGALSKPVFALAQSVGVVFGARVFDRMGKGIRGAPRDALVADMVEPEMRGRAFGLRQSLDTVGAFLGPIIAIGLMHLTLNNYRLIFWVAVVPGALAVLALVFGVHEPQRSAPLNPSKRLRFSDIHSLGSGYWLVVGVGAIFQLARFSEAFLILRARDLGLALGFVPAVLIIMNIVYAVSAYPLGDLSDRIERKWFLAGGFVCLIVADLFLGLGSNMIHVGIGICFWGLHLGMTQGILAALIANTCGPELRGTAYGMFSFASAIALLLASTLAGFLWDQVGPKSTFIVASAFTSFSLATLLVYSLKTR